MIEVSYILYIVLLYILVSYSMLKCYIKYVVYVEIVLRQPQTKTSKMIGALGHAFRAWGRSIDKIGRSLQGNTGYVETRE